MTDALHALGWDDRLAASLAAACPQGGAPGRVARVDRGGWLTLETATGDVRARLHPRFRRPSDPLEVPTVGDWVVVPPRGVGEPIVETVLPRRTALVRNAGGDERDVRQVLAANVDTVLVALPLDGDRNPRRTDRFCNLAWSGGARPALLLTKADTVPVEEVRAAVAEASQHGAPVHTVSARDGAGLAALEPYLGPGQTVVLLGVSGAGKSTLANRLLGQDVLDTAAVRRDGKGRHKTTHRALLRLPTGGVLIDTPGLRSVAAWDDGAEDAFGDVERVAATCHFSDCTHEREPGCAVQEAVATGALDPGRVDSYRTLRREQEALAARRAVAERRSRRGGRGARRPPGSGVRGR